MRRPAHGARHLVVCLLALAACGSGPRVEGVDLELRPLADAWAISVRLERGGEAEAVRHAPHLLAVAEVRRGRLPPAEADRLLERAAAARRQGPPPGEDRPEEGDVFALTLRLAERPNERITGLIGGAPEPTAAVIEALRALPERLAPVAPAAGYLRSEPVSEERLATIRRRGRIPELDVAQAPPALRPILAAAALPYRFHPLSAAEYEALRSRGGELILVAREGAYQLSLYTAWTGPTP